MALTRHGHHIPGSGEDLNPPTQVANCGKPGLCIICNQDCAAYREPQIEEVSTDEPTLVRYPSPFSNIQQCLTCHVLLGIKADRCPICDPIKE